MRCSPELDSGALFLGGGVLPSTFPIFISSIREPHPTVDFSRDFGIFELSFLLLKLSYCCVEGTNFAVGVGEREAT